MIDKTILIDELIKRKEIYEFLNGPYVGCLIVYEKTTDRETYTSIFKLASVFDEIEINEDIEDFFDEDKVWTDRLTMELETTYLYPEKENLLEWNKNPNNGHQNKRVRLATNEEIETYIDKKIKQSTER